MKSTAPTDPHPKSTQRVLDAVQELSRLEQVATRENVAELTGLPLTTVDDRLKSLTDDGKLTRIMRGVYVVAATYPLTRPVTVTEIPDGFVTAEVGDQVLVLTPREARMLGRALAGHVDDFRAGESTRHHMILATELISTVRAMERSVRDLRQREHGGTTSPAAAHLQQDQPKAAAAG